jgi:hypothetical protein
MRLDSSGRLGIGTATPGALLDVAASATRQIRIATESSNSAGLVQCTESAGNNRDIALGGQNITFCVGTFDSTSRSERARLTTDGKLLVGTSTARSQLGITPGVQSEGTDFSQGTLALTVNSTSAYPLISLARSRGATLGSNTIVADGDIVGKIFFTAADGNDMASAAATIEAVIDGTPGSDDLPGRLVFSVTKDGQSSPTEAMRINNSGFVLVGTQSNAENYGFNYKYNGGITNGLYVASTATSGDGSFLTTWSRGYTINNTSPALYYTEPGATRFEVRNNGGIANYSANNVNLSDRNAKKDIEPAAGTWDCLKEWEIVNFRYKDQPDDADLNMGVIAQQVAESCPEVITVFQEAKEATEDQPAQEERLGVKDQQMVWMAIKALQEAQLRIEALEAEVTALKAH